MLIFVSIAVEHAVSVVLYVLMATSVRWEHGVMYCIHLLLVWVRTYCRYLVPY